MFRVVDCISLQPDRALLVFAGLFCVFGSLSTVLTARRLDSAQRAQRWRTMVAFCAATTVWSTHYLAMRAYRPRVAAAFDVPHILLSFVASLVVMGPALARLSRA